MPVVGGRPGAPPEGFYLSEAEGDERFAPARAAAEHIVDADDTDQYQTLAAAIFAAAAGDTIRVVSNLTITEPVTIDRAVTIEWAQGATVYNNTEGSTAFRTSKHGSTAGSVANVVLRNLRLTRGPSLTGAQRGGKAVDMKGALFWKIDNLYVAYHSKGLWFDADPYPSGYCFHNIVNGARIEWCTTGVEATTTVPNANTLNDVSLYNCDHPVIHDGGIAFAFNNLSIENTGTLNTTDPMIETNGQSLLISGLYCEAGASNPAIDVQADAVGANITGFVTNTTGTVMNVADGAERITIDLPAQKPLTVRRAGVAADFSRTHDGAIVDEIVTFNSRDNGETADVLRFAPVSDGTFYVTTLDAAPSAIAYTRTEGQHYWHRYENQLTMRFWRDDAWHRMLVDDDGFSHVTLPTITATTTLTVAYNRQAPLYKELWVVPQGAVTGYTEGVNYWTVAAEEWSGNSKIADAWSTVVDENLADNVRIGSSAIDYQAEAGGRYLRLKFTKTGSPGDWPTPLVIVRWEWA